MFKTKLVAPRRGYLGWLPVANINLSCYSAVVPVDRNSWPLVSRHIKQRRWCPAGSFSHVWAVRPVWSDHRLNQDRSRTNADTLNVPEGLHLVVFCFCPSSSKPRPTELLALFEVPKAKTTMMRSSGWFLHSSYKRGLSPGQDRR